MNTIALEYENRISNRTRERKIRRDKYKRKAEIRKHIFQLVFAVCFICFIVLGANSLISKAGTSKDAESSFKYYKNIPVEQGDTLLSIADTYADKEHYASADKYVREVRLMNHLEEDDTVYAGDYLIIPYYSDILK